MKIGIAGIGGIGSNVALHLVRSGIKWIKIVDFDRVEESNLNRQFYFRDQIGMYKVDALEINLKRINPEVSILKEIKKLCKENIVETFIECDIVVEGFDGNVDKVMLINSFSPLKKFIVSANGVAGFKTEDVSVRKVGETLYIVGDFKSDIKNNELFSHKVGLVACKMCELVLDIISQNFDRTILSG